MASAVAEAVAGFLFTERRQRGVVSDAPECHDRGQALEAGDLILEEAVAALDLLRQRLFLGRHRAYRAGDHAVDQSEAVLRVGAIDACSEAEALQRRIEELAGIVAGERPAGTIGAAQARREADHQESRFIVAE